MKNKRALTKAKKTCGRQDKMNIKSHNKTWFSVDRDAFQNPHVS
jgi:hypothetical protein